MSAVAVPLAGNEPLKKPMPPTLPEIAASMTVRALRPLKILLVLLESGVEPWQPEQLA